MLKGIWLEEHYITPRQQLQVLLWAGLILGVLALLVWLVVDWLT